MSGAAQHHVIQPRARSIMVTVVATLLALTAAPSSSEAAILPPNELWQEDNRLTATGITEQQFNAILDEILLQYRPRFFFFGATLVVNRFWNDSTVNAFAHRSGNRWIIDMYGGLARRPEITPDGFTIVACHEIGHHLGGYPFYPNIFASAEGQADTYATQACARFLWRVDPANAGIAAQAPPTVRAQCAIAWTSIADRYLCARIALASKSISDLFATLEGRTVDYDSLDMNTVAQTRSSHPPAQCRLDTYFAAARCGVSFNFDIIPGAGDPLGPNSVHAELTAATASCMPAAVFMGTPGYNGHDRPRCWFAPQVR